MVHNVEIKIHPMNLYKMVPNTHYMIYDSQSTSWYSVYTPGAEILKTWALDNSKQYDVSQLKHTSTFMMRMPKVKESVVTFLPQD